MKRLRNIVFIIFAFTITLGTLFFGITIYNNIPSLENNPKPTIAKISNKINSNSLKSFKVLSYNIRFGSGSNQKRINAIDKVTLKQKLNKIANVLIESRADIVFLQEVDINSKRSHKINQGKYIAKKAGYSYCAYASYWKRKIFPDINGRHGYLDHGLSILSKFPLSNHKAQVFEIPRQIPFFLRWLFNPHGVQKVDVRIGNETITLINLHLEPWSYKEREKQIKKVIRWIKPLDNPTILAGDLNVEPPETPYKSVYHLKDKPWFISIDQESLKKEKTINLIQQQGFTSSINLKSYLNNPKYFYSYPSINPQVKLDYIFVNKKLKIINDYIFHEAKDASDHLPIITEVKLSP